MFPDARLARQDAERLKHFATCYTRQYLGPPLRRGPRPSEWWSSALITCVEGEDDEGQDDTSSNISQNPAFSAIFTQALSRRRVLQGGLLAAGVALFGGPTGSVLGRSAEAGTSLFSFEGIPASKADQVVVPSGYTAQVFFAWGDPISDGPAFKPDASNTAEEQMLQAGMHHDAIHFFPLPMGSDSSTRGLLAINHEYTDDGLLHVGGMEPWTAEKVAKSQAAHGVSIIEVAFEGGQWKVVRPSTYARRITGRTPIRFSGPAAGHGLLQTAADPAGTTVLGTLNNCAHGVTPWGTYLTCEENFNGYFVNPSGDIAGVTDSDQKIRHPQGAKPLRHYQDGGWLPLA